MTKLKILIALLTLVIVSCNKSEEDRFIPASTLIESIEGTYRISPIEINNQQVYVNGYVGFQKFSDTEILFSVVYDVRDKDESMSIKLSKPTTIHGKPYNVYFENNDLVTVKTQSDTHENVPVWVKGQMAEPFFGTRAPYTPSYEGLIEIKIDLPQESITIKIDSMVW